MTTNVVLAMVSWTIRQAVRSKHHLEERLEVFEKAFLLSARGEVLTSLPP